MNRRSFIRNLALLPGVALVGTQIKKPAPIPQTTITLPPAKDMKLGQTLIIVSGGRDWIEIGRTEEISMSAGPLTKTLRDDPEFSWWTK